MYGTFTESVYAYACTSSSRVYCHLFLIAIDFFAKLTDHGISKVEYALSIIQASINPVQQKPFLVNIVREYCDYFSPFQQ